MLADCAAADHMYAGYAASERRVQWAEICPMLSVDQSLVVQSLHAGLVWDLGHGGWLAAAGLALAHTIGADCSIPCSDLVHFDTVIHCQWD